MLNKVIVRVLAVVAGGGVLQGLGKGHLVGWDYMTYYVTPHPTFHLCSHYFYQFYHFSTAWTWQTLPLYSTLVNHTWQTSIQRPFHGQIYPLYKRYFNINGGRTLLNVVTNCRLCIVDCRTLWSRVKPSCLCCIASIPILISVGLARKFKASTRTKSNW